MAACDIFSKFVNRVAVVGTVPVSGPVVITFPTALIAKTQGTNTQVSVGPGVAVTVLAANANRKNAQITNPNGSVMFVAMGAAATVASHPLPTYQPWKVEPDTIGEVNQQLVSVFNPTAGALLVNVYEE